MLKNNAILTTKKIDGWFDCGRTDLLLENHKVVLKKTKIDPSSTLENTKIIEPVFIGKDVFIKDSIIGPFVSINKSSIIKKSILEESIINDNVTIINSKLNSSLVGSNSIIKDQNGKLIISANSIIEYGNK